MTRSRRILIDILDALDHQSTFEDRLSELDAAIAALVQAAANDYFAARERLLPNPFLEY